jgi:Pyridoxamine 5'-phosphate oxidase
MIEPKASRPHWPDALQNPTDVATGLKPWSWAVDRLEKSHNYWFATTRLGGQPHLMPVWGVWLEDSFWFCTGARTRKAKNLATQSLCVIGTEDADEAVILEGSSQQVTDAAQIKKLVAAYNQKYGGNVEPLLAGSASLVFRVLPRTVFAFDEHAEDFTLSATRWQF